MPRTADVIVVGAGIIGCAVARELARRGARVRIFESRSVGSGATQASAGVLAPYIEAPASGTLLDLGIRSLAMYEDFVRGVTDESGVLVEYGRPGTLEIAIDEKQVEHLNRWSGSVAGVEREWLSVERARELEPALPESIRGAMLVRSHGYVAASQLTEALTWAALRFGAEFEAGRRITRLSPGEPGVQVLAEDGSSWSAGAAVLATGSWSGWMGLAEPAAAAVKPIRGQLLKLAWYGPGVQHVLWGPDCYVVPWKDGSILVGATVEDVGYDERTTAAGVRDLLEAVCELLPAAWRATFQEARAGLRPATPDGLPIIGPSAVLPAVIYAVGHYRNGILLAPVTATIVSDAVLEGRFDPVVNVLSPSRFEEGGQVP